MIYQVLYQALLRWLPPTVAHSFAGAVLRAVTAPAWLAKLIRRWAYPGRGKLTVKTLGLEFRSPLGAAAGIDKNADWFEALGTIGFGCVEVGTVTPAPQDPNPGPILVRVVKQRALVNRMGFPGPGVDVIVEALGPYRNATVVGANIGKQRTTEVGSAVADYRELARRLAPIADYITVNVSSPNTPGLRQLLDVSMLEPLLSAVQGAIADAAPGKPLMLKISPDMSDAELDAVVDLALALEIDGIIATNTTVERSVLGGTEGWPVRRVDGGGVSGRPLKERSLAVLRRLYAQSGGRLVLVSVGGIETVDDVWERIAHGATLVQAYTGFVYGGPAWPAAINRALVCRMRAAGYDSIQDVVGIAVDGGVGARAGARDGHESPQPEVSPNS